MRTARISSGRWHLSVRKGAVSGFFVLLLALPILGGCDDPGGVVDNAGTPPNILTIAVTPDVFLLDTAATGPGNVTLQTTVRVTVRNQSGGGTGAPNVAASIAFPGASTTLASASLREESNVSGVRTFASVMQFSVARSAIGAVLVQVDVTGPNGFPGNTVTRQIILRRTNARPLLSNLSAPDTVVVPPLDSLLIPMTVSASDPDGNEDVREVYFRSLDSSDPTRKFILLDNGNPANGDAAAGDGVYSIVVKLVESPAVHKTFRFAFQAADAVGDTSLSILHQLTVR